MCAIIRNETQKPFKISQADVKTINDLSELLYAVVPVRAPSSREGLEKLLTPEGQESIANGISSDERAQVAAQSENAIEAWQRIESAFLAGIQMDRKTFLEGIAASHSSGILPDKLNSLPAKCLGVVWNIEWVNAFVWQMPIMGPTAVEYYHDIARLMGGIFYLERYLKLKGAGPGALKAERIEALLGLVF